MVVFYIRQFYNNGLSESTTDWANFGSYFGSITGLLAFAGVLYSASLSENRAIKAEKKSKIREDRDQFFKLQNFISEEKNNSQIKENINKIIVDIRSSINEELFSKIVSALNPSKIDSMIDISVSDEDFDVATSFLDRIKDVNKSSPKYASAAEFTGSSVDFEFLLQNKYRLQVDTYSYVFFTEKKLTDLFQYIYSHYPNPKLIFQILNTNKELLEEKFVNISSYYNTYKYLIVTVNQFNNNEMYYQLIKAQLSDNEKVMLLIYSVILKENVEMVKILRDKKIIDTINENAFYLYDSSSYNISNMINGILDCYINEVNIK